MGEDKVSDCVILFLTMSATCCVYQDRPLEGYELGDNEMLVFDYVIPNYVHV